MPMRNVSSISSVHTTIATAAIAVPSSVTTSARTTTTTATTASCDRRQNLSFSHRRMSHLRFRTTQSLVTMAVFSTLASISHHRRQSESSGALWASTTAMTMNKACRALGTSRTHAHFHLLHHTVIFQLHLFTRCPQIVSAKEPF